MNINAIVIIITSVLFFIGILIALIVLANRNGETISLNKFFTKQEITLVDGEITNRYGGLNYRDIENNTDLSKNETGFSITFWMNFKNAQLNNKSDIFNLFSIHRAKSSLSTEEKALATKEEITPINSMPSPSMYFKHFESEEIRNLSEFNIEKAGTYLVSEFTLRDDSFTNSATEYNKGYLFFNIDDGLFTRIRNNTWNKFSIVYYYDTQKFATTAILYFNDSILTSSIYENRQLLKPDIVDIHILDNETSEQMKRVSFSLAKLKYYRYKLTEIPELFHKEKSDLINNVLKREHPLAINRDTVHNLTTYDFNDHW